MAMFWPLFVVFLSNAPRLKSPWLERSADAGLGVEDPLIAALIDLALIAAFGLQHSVMARPAAKRRWHALVPEGCERSTYVHAANVVLIALVALWQPIPIDVWRLDAPLLRDACWAAFGLGWTILLAGALSFGLGELIGVSQSVDRYLGRAPRALALKTRGLYRWLRHPMYVGVLLAVWATPTMTVGHLLLATGFTVYVLIARRYEERDLRRTYGGAYRAWTASAAPAP